MSDGEKPDRIQELLTQHMLLNPRTFRLFQTDPQFHQAVHISCTVLASAVQQMESQYVSEFAVDQVIKGILHQILSDQSMAEEEERRRVAAYAEYKNNSAELIKMLFTEEFPR